MLTGEKRRYSNSFKDHFHLSMCRVVMQFLFQIYDPDVANQ